MDIKRLNENVKLKIFFCEMIVINILYIIYDIGNKVYFLFIYEYFLMRKIFLNIFFTF